MVMPNPSPTDLEARLTNLENAFATLVNVVNVDKETEKLLDRKFALLNAKIDVLAAFFKLIPAPTPTKED